ncbi:MAG: diguanylate cyclase [Undibacterium sp.]|uniref:sensor domain-containing diguanylate cyclase n=1 Tax=Undibacterium sp. TaxID=1914977 RepID=UPI002717AB8E|nr:sensor domain-containing diguanylate cyclase [Undibacterium sp.]MDO8653706.1 diguanylate cyclase [Undibacterium sp.]
MKKNRKAASKVPRSLAATLGQSEQVKQKVEECAETLSTVNVVLKEEMTSSLPLNRMKDALAQSKEVEDKVEECVEDLSSVNAALEKEIADREKLEEALSKSKIEEEKTRYLAFHDGLTGLPNRALFDDRLSNALAQAQRHGRGIALLFIDLDGFKKINDNCGHATGDEILRTVAKRLSTSTRTEDTVSRHGGDEFLCLLLDIDDEKDVAKIVENMLVDVATPCDIGGVPLSVKASIGIAMFPADGATAATLIQNADAAMYVAKNKSKAQANAAGYSFFSRIEK